MGLLKTCARCKKKCFPWVMGAGDLCLACEEDIARAEAAKPVPPDPAEELRRMARELYRKERTLKDCPMESNGCVAVYTYTDVPLEGADVRILHTMFAAGDGLLDLRVDGDVIWGDWRGQPAGKIGNRQDMCKDWIERGDPIRCEILNYYPSAAKVGLVFYRDEVSRLAQKYKCEPVKLASRAGDGWGDPSGRIPRGKRLEYGKQDIDPDVKGDVVFDWRYGPIGRLPKKYVTLNNEGLIVAILYDKSERDEDRMVYTSQVYIYTDET